MNGCHSMWKKDFAGLSLVKRWWFHSERGSSDPYSNQLETLQSKPSSFRRFLKDVIFNKDTIQLKLSPKHLPQAWSDDLGGVSDSDDDLVFPFWAALKNNMDQQRASHQRPLRFWQNKLTQKTPHCDGKALERWRDDDHCVRWWLAYFSCDDAWRGWTTEFGSRNSPTWAPWGKNQLHQHTAWHTKKNCIEEMKMCSFTFHPKTTNKTWEETIAAKVNQFDLPTSFKSRSGKDKDCVRLCPLCCFEAISLSSSTVMVATSSSLVVTTWHILQDQQQKVATSGTFFDQRFSLVNGVKHVMQTYLTRHAHQKAAEKKTPPNQVMMVCGWSLLPNAASTRISSLWIWVIRVPIKAWYPGILTCVYHHYALKTTPCRNNGYLLSCWYWMGCAVASFVIQAIAMDDVEKLLNTKILAKSEDIWTISKGYTQWCMCM